jgi:excisionase family DNA binding protein
MTEVGEGALGFLTVRQVAARLNCSEKTVYRLMWAYDAGLERGLEAVTVGARSRRVAPEALAEYEAQLRSAAGKAAAGKAAAGKAAAGKAAAGKAAAGKAAAGKAAA